MILEFLDFKKKKEKDYLEEYKEFWNKFIKERGISKEDILEYLYNTIDNYAVSQENYDSEIIITSYWINGGNGNNNRLYQPKSIGGGYALFDYNDYNSKFILFKIPNPPVFNIDPKESYWKNEWRFDYPYDYERDYRQMLSYITDNEYKIYCDFYFLLKSKKCIKNELLKDIDHLKRKFNLINYDISITEDSSSNGSYFTSEITLLFQI